jgi:hypothetical protein
MDEIYLAISDELFSVAAKNYMEGLGLKPVKHLALFNNQYRYEKEENGYFLPAVFIEFPGALFRHKGRKVDAVEDRVRIHIEQSNYADSAANSHNRAKAMVVLKTIRAISTVLLSIESELFGSFYAVSRELDSDHGNAPVHILEFKFQYTDDSTDKYKDYVKSDPDNTKLEVSKQLIEKLEPEDQEGENPYHL